MAVTLEEVTKLYVATFNRAPDAAGINYWANSGMSIENIAQSFFDQSETQTLYPSGTSNNNFVTSVYANLFNRAPDTDGLNYWVQELNNGNVSKQNFILAVINGAQNTAISQDATILTNKQTVGLSFVEQGLESVDFARSVMEGIDASASSVEDAVATISTVVAPVGELTTQMLDGLTLYHYDTDLDDSNFSEGYDALWKTTFNPDGTITDIRYTAPFGSSNWLQTETQTLSYTLSSGRVYIQGHEGNESWTDTLTLLSMTSTHIQFYDEMSSTDTQGTVATTDDITQNEEDFFTWMLSQPSARTEQEIFGDNTSGVTFVEGGSYYQGEGVSTSGGVDYEVNVTATTANVSTMLGDLVNTAFIINIHDTMADQTIIGTAKNDVFNWQGGSDTFNGNSDGGNWYNGGSDAVSHNISSSTSAITFNTSSPNTLKIMEGTNTLATIFKNTDGSFDVSSGNDTLHLINTELFRLYVTSQTGGEVFSAFNIDVDLTGVQTGEFDAIFA